MSRSLTLLEELTECETRVWDALVSGNAGADAAALSEDFLGVYPDGFSDKATHVGQLASGPTVARFQLDQLQVIPLGSSHALLAYRARYQKVGKVMEEHMYVSSVWQRDGVGWINIFSQDTPADADHDLP